MHANPPYAPNPGHRFMPNPQPPPLPNGVVVRSTPDESIVAVRRGGTWEAVIRGVTNKQGRGQAATWLDAVNAAIEDLQEKS